MRSAQFFQDYRKQVLDKNLAKLRGNAAIPERFEPYKDAAISIVATVRTEAEFVNYLSRMGTFGQVAYMAALLAVTQRPELAAYIPDYSVAKESLKLAEQGRDQSGSVQHAVPQINMDRQGTHPTHSYRKEPLSYQKYSLLIYLKSSAQKLYSPVESEVKKLFAGIRSVYQSSTGAFRARADYKGQHNVLTHRGTSLDACKKAPQRRRYYPDDTQNLEQLLKAA
ncbi:MAG: hypothetical protein AABX33_02210 [Nanoarchaeota archaeon]